MSQWRGSNVGYHYRDSHNQESSRHSGNNSWEPPRDKNTKYDPQNGRATLNKDSGGEEDEQGREGEWKRWGKERQEWRKAEREQPFEGDTPCRPDKKGEAQWGSVKSI